MEKTKEINIQELLYAILNKIWLVIIAALVGGIGMFVVTENFITPMYSSSITMYVNNSSKVHGEDLITAITSSDLATSERLVATYVSILRSNTVMEKVSEEVFQNTGVRVSAGKIKSTMTAAAINETEVFTVRISYHDPQMAATLANAIATVAPAEIAEIVEGSSTKVVDYAKVPTAPYEPNTSTNTFLGFAAGMMLAVALIVIGELLDGRVRGEEDLAQLSSAPVLGVIPDFEMENEKGYGYGYGRKSGEENSEVKAK